MKHRTFVTVFVLYGILQASVKIFEIATAVKKKKFLILEFNQNRMIRVYHSCTRCCLVVVLLR